MCKVNMCCRYKSNTYSLIIGCTLIFFDGMLVKDILEDTVTKDSPNILHPSPPDNTKNYKLKKQP